MPTTAQQLVEAFQVWRGDYPVSSAIGGLLLRILGSGSAEIGLGGSSSGSPKTPTDGTVTTTVADILLADPDRTGFLIANHSTSAKLKINAGADASATSAILTIAPEQTINFENVLAQQRISAIVTSGTASYTIVEYTKA